MSQTLETPTITGAPVQVPDVFEADFIQATPETGRDGNSYAMGYSEIFLRLLQRRNARANAAHLLPLLEPGMNLLDLGCGPGSITLGLAEAVYPGEVTGLDQNPEQIRIARANAKEKRAENVIFITGDAMDLPFPDGSLDAVHCHGFLMHSPGIRDQLSEIGRALKPGGILASRDMDVAASFIAPAGESNRGMWQMLAEVIRQEGGDPRMGRHLKTFFINAGLTGVKAGCDTDFFDSPEEVEFLREFLLKWALSPEFTRKPSGTNGDFSLWRSQVERWSRRRGAVGCFHFGHAVGYKP